MKDSSLSRRSVIRAFVGVGAAVVAGPMFVGCDSQAGSSEIVLYTNVDQPIAVKAIAAFEKANPGVKVRLVADADATRLRAEKDRPVCHVWWGDEPFHTIALANEGYFAALSSVASLAEIDPAFRDAQDRFAGNGLRARVIAVHESAGEIQGTLDDLLDPRFRDKVGIANPLAGTMSGQIAAIYALWGDAKADEFFRRLKANGAKLVDDNRNVAKQVGNGSLMLGWTDSNAVFAAQREGGELWQVVPEQKQDQIGTLAIPTTVAVVRRDDQPADATTLAAFLLSDAAEELLMDEQFAAYSVRPSPDRVRAMKVRYADIARQITTAPKRVADLFDERAG